MEIKPIETLYRGCRFRSRLESRWAVFFDALGLEWEYEKEGYELSDGTKYLPDFWLAELQVWVEIKPKVSYYGACELEHYKKLDLLQEMTGNFYYLIYGTPGVVELYNEKDPYYAWASGDYPYIWCECPGCGTVAMQFEGRAARNHHHPGCNITGDKTYNSESQRLLYAYDAARGARFEHNEIPTPYIFNDITPKANKHDDIPF